VKRRGKRPKKRNEVNEGGEEGHVEVRRKETSHCLMKANGEGNKP